MNYVILKCLLLSFITMLCSCAVFEKSNERELAQTAVARMIEELSVIVRNNYNNVGNIEDVVKEVTIGLNSLKESKDAVGEFKSTKISGLTILKGVKGRNNFFSITLSSSKKPPVLIEQPLSDSSTRYTIVSPKPSETTRNTKLGATAADGADFRAAPPRPVGTGDGFPVITPQLRTAAQGNPDIARVIAAAENKDYPINFAECSLTSVCALTGKDCDPDNFRLLEQHFDTVLTNAKKDTFPQNPNEALVVMEAGMEPVFPGNVAVKKEILSLEKKTCNFTYADPIP